jgi:endonuclease V-like protein UPF0215 family
VSGGLTFEEAVAETEAIIREHVEDEETRRKILTDVGVKMMVKREYRLAGICFESAGVSPYDVADLILDHFAERDRGGAAVLSEVLSKGEPPPQGES